MTGPERRLRSRIVFASAVALFVSGACGDQQEAVGMRSPPLTLADIDVKMEFGGENDEWLGVLRRPMDAVLMENEVIVLDAAPPWVRVFSRDGRYLRAMVDRGEGPGEARLPYTLRGTEDGGLIVAHSRGIESLDSDGTVRQSVRHAGEYSIRGATEACGGRILALGRRSGDAGGEALILPYESGAVLPEAIAVFDTMRPQAQIRRRHASFLRRSDGGMILYPEETNHHRLMEIACDGSVIRELHVDPLGLPERTALPPPGERAPGRFAVRAAEPPFPGGIAEINGRVLWAALVADSLLDGRIDSTTVVTAFDSTGGAAQLSIRGWYQLFDSDSKGMLLLGNADGLHPSVLLVDGNALVGRIDEVPRQ
jgi:hypothetical protein